MPLILVCWLDWITKKMALSLSGIHNFGILHFELIFNQGVIFGLSSQLPLLVKLVSLTTIGAIVLCSYTMATIILPIRSVWLRLGLPIFVGGITGNVIDRFIHSAVVDFFSIQIYQYRTPVLNIADLCQWIGIMFIVSGLYQDSRYYWPKQDWRNKFFINPGFQIRIGIIMALFSFATGFIALAFSFSFFQGNLVQENINFFLGFGTTLIIFLSVVSFAIGIILSHRVAGPIFALKRFLNESCEKNHLTFKLRENDEFKELESQLTLLNAEMQRLYDIERQSKN